MASLPDAAAGAGARRFTGATRLPVATPRCSIPRAMYTHPGYARRGVGRLILALCEDAARSEGFTSAELMATMAGEPLYRACGYLAVEPVVDDRGGVGVPLLRMRKDLA
jgi:GNAT superfamily N-acetyltransferase